MKKSKTIFYLQTTFKVNIVRIMYMYTRFFFKKKIENFATILN
jgi:hypothetical protein